MDIPDDKTQVNTAVSKPVIARMLEPPKRKAAANHAAAAVATAESH
jgi:hypothetical protein